MKKMWDANLLVKLLLAVVLIALMGIAPYPHRALEYLWLARHSYESGNPASAAANLAQAANDFPWQPALWEKAGFYALQAQSYDEASQYLTKADERRALTSSGLLALGDAYYALGDPDRAIFHWRRSTSSPELHLRLAQVHTAAGDYTALVEDYQTVLSFNPNDSAANYHLGLVYAAVQPDLALTYLQIAGALNKDYANDTRRLHQAIRTASLFDEPAYTLLESGRVLAGMQEWRLAAYAFYQAVVARPDYAEAWALLGEARQHLAEGDSALTTQFPTGELSMALENLEQAVQLDPQSILANALLGLYWQRLGDYDQAVKYLSISAELDPRNPAFQAELGNCLAQKGDLNGALGFYQKAVDLDPQDSTYWRILGSFSLRHHVQLRDIGLPAARQASILSPSDPMSLDLMGQVLSSLSDFANAERFFLRAISEDPQFAPAYLHYGINYLIQGDHAQARQQIENAFRLSPESPTGQQAARILQRYFP